MSLDEKIKYLETENAYLKELHKTYHTESKAALEKLSIAALNNENVFEQLMKASKYCSIGQITDDLFEVGGQYRRNM